MCKKSTIFFTERHLLQKAVKFTHNIKSPFSFEEQYPLLDVMMCRNTLDMEDSKVLATQLSQPISSPLCCRVIQAPIPTPKINHKVPQNAEKFTIFLQIWRTLPWRIGTRSRKAKMKNTLFFFPKLLFVPDSIANNFSLYRCYNLSYLLLSFTKYKYTVYTGMYFHQNTSYQTQSFTYHTTQWWNHAKRRRSARDPRLQVSSPAQQTPHHQRGLLSPPPSSSKLLLIKYQNIQ